MVAVARFQALVTVLVREIGHLAAVGLAPRHGGIQRVVTMDVIARAAAYVFVLGAIVRVEGARVGACVTVQELVGLFRGAVGLVAYAVRVDVLFASIAADALMARHAAELYFNHGGALGHALFKAAF